MESRWSTEIFYSKDEYDLGAWREASLSRWATGNGQFQKCLLVRHGAYRSGTLENDEREIGHHCDAALSRWATALH